MNSSKPKARMLIASLLATFIAVMSTSMTASAIGTPAEPAASGTVEGAIQESEEIGPDSDAASCLPAGAGCHVNYDNCCGGCVLIIGGVAGVCG